MTKQDSSAKVSLPSKEDTNQTRSLDLDQTTKLDGVTIDPNQSRSVGMFKESSNFDRIDRENPFVGMASNPCGGSSRKDG